jgi:hypothetical protein
MWILYCESYLIGFLCFLKKYNFFERQRLDYDKNKNDYQLVCEYIDFNIDFIKVKVLKYLL